MKPREQHLDVCLPAVMAKALPGYIRWRGTNILLGCTGNRAFVPPIPYRLRRIGLDVWRFSKEQEYPDAVINVFTVLRACQCQFIRIPAVQLAPISP
jgi:hypothetical protein